MWTPKIIPEAEKSFAKFDKSLKIQIAAGIMKVSTNPLPQPAGYGKPLGNKGGNNLTGFFKIKYKGIGIRVVFIPNFPLSRSLDRRPHRKRVYW